jgi:tetratricopeptide (TPR) repeat protein
MGSNCFDWSEQDLMTGLKKAELKLFKARQHQEEEAIIANLKAVAKYQCQLGQTRRVIQTHKELVDKYHSKCQSAVLATKKDLTEATEVYVQAIKHYKVGGKGKLVNQTMFDLGQLFVRLKDYSKAATFFREASFGFDLEMYKKATAEMLHCSEMLQLAKKKENNDDHDAPLNEVQINPDMNLILNFFNKGQYPKALEHFYKIKNLDNSSFKDKCDLFKIAAQSHIYLEQFQEAIKVCHEHLDLLHKLAKAPMNNIKLEIYGRLSHSRLNIMEFIDCIDICKEGLEILTNYEDDNMKATFLNNIGVACTQIDQFDQALDSSKSSLEVEQKLVRSGAKKATYFHKAFENVAIAYMGLKDYNNAIKYLQKAWKANEDHSRIVEDQSRIMATLGICSKKLGNQGFALHVLLKALEAKKTFYGPGECTNGDMGSLLVTIGA